jgi:hypothetical protein
VISSLELLLDLIIIVVFITIIDIVIPSPRVFHNERRKRRIDRGLGGLKTHGRTHLMLALL